VNLQKPSEKSVTEVRIVEAAAQLFARHGFKSATTREIAHFADINEATLFRYFPRKPDLFWAAVESRLGRVKLGRNLHVSLAADSDPAVALPMLVAFLLNSFSQHPELSRLLHVAAFELPEAEKMISEHLGPIFDMISGYFRRCAAKGVIGNVEPSLAVLGLVGSVCAHQALHELFTGERLTNSDTAEATAAYVQLWLQALKPPTAEAADRTV
jgi:AcrR family transcriptional regulator